MQRHMMNMLAMYQMCIDPGQDPWGWDSPTASANTLAASANTLTFRIVVPLGDSQVSEREARAVCSLYNL